jgi:uncharacterized delta-60 repeat protein
MKTLTPLFTAVLSLLFLSPELVLAGAPPIQWQKTFGGSKIEYGESVQQTSDGGYIITGYTDSYGAGDYDVYLIKTDPNGNSQWQKTFGGTDSDYGYSVRQTSDGGYIIAGRTESYGAGGYDVYLIKTEPNGNSEWEKTFGGSSYDSGSSVQQTTDGGYIVVGLTESFGAVNFDVYLIKTDPNGNTEWQKTFGGSSTDSGKSVQQTSDGGYIIAGFTYSYGAGGDDVYLVKTDPNGNSQWQKTFGGSRPDYGQSVRQTFDGGYIVTGFTYSYGAGQADVYLIKTDPNGNSQWQKTFGGSNYDYSWSVQQTADDGYIIVGYTRSYGAGSDDVYLIKTDPNGNSQWQRTFGGNDKDIGYFVQQAADGGYIIAGHTKSYGAEDYDVYLIKLCPDGTLSADFNCNGTVYFEDLDILASEWLQPSIMLFTDIAPELGDGIVNGFDFAAFADYWLQTTNP